MPSWHREEDMGPRATRFALVFWMALAVAVIILSIKPWAGAGAKTRRAGRQRPFRRGRSSISRNTGKCFEDRQIVRGNPSLPDTSLPDIGIGSIGRGRP